jgi:hypothetical protein
VPLMSPIALIDATEPAPVNARLTPCKLNPTPDLLHHLPRAGDRPPQLR